MNSEIRTVEELTGYLRDRTNALRNMATLVQRPDFKGLFEDAPAGEKNKAVELINIFDQESLRKWYRQRRAEQLGILSVRELRDIASDLRIPNYTTLPKSLLLSAIAQRKAQDEDNPHDAYKASA